VSERHPLKRKSIKPSSSTVRGMLPAKQHKVLEAAMQGLRAIGLRFEWVWRGQRVGWVSTGYVDETVVCELYPTEEPVVGKVKLTPDQIERAKEAKQILTKFKKVLDFPIEVEKGKNVYEFDLAQRVMRDLFSEFVEQLRPVLEDD